MGFPLSRILPIFFLCFARQPYAMAQTAQDRSVHSAVNVLDEVMAIPAQQIPQSLLANVSAVAICPNVVKGGFVVVVQLGRGVILVRDDQGQWHPPMRDGSPADGVVPVSSARHPAAISEKYVDATHTGLLGDQETSNELAGILADHIREFDASRSRH